MTKIIEACQFDMSGLHTQTTLDILPLGSYDMVIGMDKLATHKEKIYCYNKTLACEDIE